ncbi:PCO ADO [Lotmaria passim]
MKRLIGSLQHFSKTSTEHVELFSKLTLKDFGIYVSATDAVSYTHDNNYPIDDKVFLLKNSLFQCRYDATALRFVPQPWKMSAVDQLGCSTLYQDEQVTLCWFVIPPGRVLPLHDHPGMTVWQRVMHGRLHICSLVSDAPPATMKSSPDATPATVVFSGEVDGIGEAVYPARVFTFGERDGSMLHEIRNVDPERPALFVDIIAPPYYQSPTNIPCGYYGAEPVNKNTENLEGLPSECGIHWMLRAGDKALLHPRPDYLGPAMDAYVHVA